MSGGLTRTLAVLVVVLVGLSGCIASDGELTGNGRIRDLSSPDFELGENEALITGLVIDPEFYPVPGAIVALDPTDLVAEVDADGAFVLGPLEPGTYIVIAERPGYASASVEVTVRGGERAEVILTLDPTAADVPHAETIFLHGYVQCHFFWTQPTPVGNPTLNAPCIGAIDLLTGQNVSNDEFIFPFTISQLGFTTLLIEMSWQRQQFGTNAVAVLWGSREAIQSSGTTTQYFGMGSGPPLRALVHAGEVNPGSTGGDTVFYPDPNTTQEYQYVWAGGGGNTTVPNVALFLEMRADIYLTLFYNRPGSLDFSMLPDA